MIKARLGYVYALHFGDHNYFYVGCTSTSVEKRLAWHVYHAVLDTASAGVVTARIREMGIQHLQVDLIATTTRDQRYELEVRMIQKLKDSGYALVNRTRGGLGMPGYKFTSKQRARHSAMALEVQNRAEVKSKNKVRTADPEWKLKHSVSMSAMWTDERREKLSKTQRAKFEDPEYRAKQLAIRRSTEVVEKLAATLATPEFKAKKSRVTKEVANRPEEVQRVRERNTRQWSDPEYKAKTGASISAGLKKRYVCDDCGYENNAAHIGRHLKKAGHHGRTPVSPETQL